MSVKELLLKPIVMPTETVPLPELGDGVSVTVRGLSTKEKGAFEMQFVKNGQPDTAKQRQMRERLIAACCIDETGARMFTVDDVAQLGLQAVVIVDRIYEACQRVNGDKPAEQLEKNSDGTGDAS